MSTPTREIEAAVGRRYSEAASTRVEALCCPTDYDQRYLEILPEEIVARDYGCGDPSRHLRPGETVLDLGSGAGKICYIASQIVGPDGTVLGVDMNDEMLELAESHRRSIGDRLGYHNVRFLKGKIQDLALSYAKLEEWLALRPVQTVADLEALEAWKRDQRQNHPMIGNATVDVIVSNCVLNLVDPQAKAQLFREMYRVLRDGGRAVISDIVCDEDVPPHLQADPELWSGCISGAYREDRFLAAFEQAGLHGMRLLARESRPWRVVEGIEFRSVTVEAFKGKEGPCLERCQAVIYTGPWRSVTDDDGHTLERGQRMAVSDKTLSIYTREPYAGSIVPVLPYDEVPLESAAPFDESRDRLRSPRETKGEGYDGNREPDDPCCGGGDCA